MDKGEHGKIMEKAGFRRIVFLFLMFFIILTAVMYAQAENLLDNADFSQIDEDGEPDYWYTDAYILDAGYSVFNIREGEGEHPIYAEIKNVGSNDARYAQVVAVDPDSLYCLSGYVLADGVKGGQGANLSVEGVYAFSEKSYETNGEWHYIEYYGETGPDQEYITVFARLGGYSGESTGRAAFAELSLKKVDSVPGDKVADLWYKEESSEEAYGEEPDEDWEDEKTVNPAWPWLLIIIAVYGFTVLAAVRHNSLRPVLKEEKGYSAYAAMILLGALAIRIILSALVQGYMVDVNCFVSWGRTMATVGPTQFYQATNFCDYPPLYTYVLGLNSATASMLGNGEAIKRIVFRLIPSLCDVAACWILFKILVERKGTDRPKSLLFVTFLALNPATIINSAAWGQMDSVLCLLLVTVAILAAEKKWTAVLPLYMLSVLIKPQALMLGPLGLCYIIISLIKDSDSRKPMIRGTLISLGVLAAGVIPFSINQKYDWLIQLYARTLSSYPYATVNTANFYYLLGGNWNGIEKTAHILAPILLCLFSFGYGAWWYLTAKEIKLKIIEVFICILFGTAFILCTALGASWGLVGGIAMGFAFMIVLSPAIRSKDIRLLSYLGALLYILLYVFGVKMHERYVFPALLLLAAAWIAIRDRRIIYIFILITTTLFLNEGIVLDNSIRLGSSLGHLNQDTVWLADILSIINILTAVYATYLAVELLIGRKAKSVHSGAILPVRCLKKRNPTEWNPDRKLHWTSRDTIILAVITAVYSVVSLLTLGSTKAPQTAWTSSSADEQIIFDLGENHNDFEMLYFAQVSRYDFSVAVSENGEDWSEETWAQMDQGQCWKWKYVTESYDNGSEKRNYYNSDLNHVVRFSGRYVRLTSCQLGLVLNEILFRQENGSVLHATILEQIGSEPDSELYSDPFALLDEQDTMEKLPAFPETEETRSMTAEPSWWNSSYFDEIYHARTAFEFLKGTVPYETSHPPLGKILMSVCVAIFGMTPFGWRFAGAMAGILMLPGMYLIVKQLTKKTGLATLACLLMALDCQHLTQSQIATIDSFPVLFIIFAFFFMLRFMQTDFMKEKFRNTLVTLGLCGLFMGLSIASKWIGIYAGVGLAILFFWHCFRVSHIYREAEILTRQKELNTEIRNKLLSMIEKGKKPKDVTRRIIRICLWCVLFFVAVPVVIYLISYIPYMAYNSKRIKTFWDYLSEVWRAQVGMLNYHSTPGLGMDHPFYSPWWEWPIIGKPMYYAAKQYLPTESPVSYSIFCFGNPVIWYSGLGALLYCFFRMLKGKRYKISEEGTIWHLNAETYDPRYGYLFIGLLAQYLPWVLVPRGTYIYHYFASLPFLMISICLCFDGYSEKYRRFARIAGILLIVLSLASFIILFPYASGIAVSEEWLNVGKNILKIWY